MTLGRKGLMVQNCFYFCRTDTFYRNAKLIKPITSIKITRWDGLIGPHWKLDKVLKNDYFKCLFRITRSVMHKTCALIAHDGSSTHS